VIGWTHDFPDVYWKPFSGHRVFARWAEQC
jgi:hypothetical protein